MSSKTKSQSSRQQKQQAQQSSRTRQAAELSSRNSKIRKQQAQQQKQQAQHEHQNQINQQNAQQQEPEQTASPAREQQTRTSSNRLSTSSSVGNRCSARSNSSGNSKLQQQQVWQQHRSNNWDNDHRNWQQRGGYNGYRIPDNDFRGHYGRSHWFRIYSLPFMYQGGYPRFQYGGYWFMVMDPYPDYWGNDWYESDDVYVDYYGDGYYLFNRRYPNRPGIAISISF